MKVKISEKGQLIKRAVFPLRL